ncbi:MAG: amino acid--tRNA ligase-related protein, partial [Candidatus Micrarchaeaceae archaeon]
MFHTGLRSHYAKELSAAMDGKEVVLCGWVHEVRNVGKIIFLILRDSTGMVQVVGKEGATPAEVMKGMNLQKESVVAITGKVKANAEAKMGFEVLPSRIENLNPLAETMPFDVAGMAQPDLDVRLDYRYVDLRKSTTAAIFKVQSTILNSFRSFFEKRGFQEVRTPSIVGEATEGGAELFGIEYFDRKAYLAQSPQLYKQLAIIGGIDKVFMIVPVFRAEKFNTIYHLNESTQMDIEIGFAGYSDAIKLLKGVAIHMVKSVEAKNSEELEKLQVEIGAKKVREVTYSQAIK